MKNLTSMRFSPLVSKLKIMIEEQLINKILIDVKKYKKQYIA